MMPVDFDHHPGPIQVDGANATFPSDLSHSMAANTGDIEFGLIEFGLNFQVGSEFESGFNDLNFDFNEFEFLQNTDNFDFENVGATFGYKQGFMEAALLIGVEENRSNNFPADNTRLVLSPYSSHPNVNTTSAGLSSPDLSSTTGSGMLSAPTGPTLQEPDGLHAHNRPTKRKKVNEVNAAHILPEGLQRSRTKSAKAAATMEST
jgi:hypothetical protein